MPIASFVTVFHRVTPFLLPAVQSILGQTLTDLELILVDNGTGVGTQPLGPAGQDPRIRMVSLPSNLGIAAGLNAGVAAARGEFVALLDSDDIALPRRLERQVAALRADPALGLVSSCAETIDGEGCVIGREFALVGATEQQVFTAYSMPAPAPSYTGRVECFRRFPYEPAFRFAMDYDFVARVAEVHGIAGVPEVLMQYRSHSQQVSVLEPAEQILNACIIRLLTARRRAGRSEDSAATLAVMARWLAEGLAVREIYRRFADWSLRERFPLLAVYHARKVVSARRRPIEAVWATGILARALRQSQTNRGLLLRMFFGGPLRAHGLKPA